MQRLFPDDLGTDRTFRLIRDRVLIVELWTVWQVLEDRINHIINVLSAQCGGRNNFREIIDLAISINELKHLILLHSIHLVDDQNDRCLYLAKLLGDMLLAGTDKVARLDEPENNIHFV